jgi:ActR/RegA family two-component response regulator
MLDERNCGRAVWEPRPFVVIADASGYWSRKLTASFELIGYDALVVADIKDGAESLAANVPSLVVSEIELRHGSGLDFLQVVRARGDIPFVVVTATSSISVVLAAYRLGCKAFLTKPTTAVEVLEMVGMAPPGDSREPGLTLQVAAREYVTGTLRDAGTLAEAARRLHLDKRSLRRMLGRLVERPMPVEHHMGQPGAG